jgi:hypothetical protein
MDFRDNDQGMKQVREAKEDSRGNQRQGWVCVIQSQSGSSTKGGAEKHPAGDYSANDWSTQSQRISDCAVKRYVLSLFY